MTNTNIVHFLLWIIQFKVRRVRFNVYKLSNFKAQCWPKVDIYLLYNINQTSESSTRCPDVWESDLSVMTFNSGEECVWTWRIYVFVYTCLNAPESLSRSAACYEGSRVWKNHKRCSQRCFSSVLAPASAYHYSFKWIFTFAVEVSARQKSQWRCKICRMLVFNRLCGC